VSAAPTRVESPRASEIAEVTQPIRDAVLRAPPRRLLALGYWGGAYTAPTGESVTIYASRSYPADDAANQRWANFLAGLVHGPELSSLTVYLAPLDEVKSTCGPEAEACYNAARSTLFAPGEDLPNGTSAEAVVTHEYGHHVAAHRSNAPWPAEDLGTKRWASYEQVCSKTASGILFPGDEQLHYTFNPGEAFAESYRVLNERRAGTPEPPWQVVDQSLYPDDTALQLLEQDVLDPWTGPASASFSGTLVATGARRRTYTVTDALDGALQLTLRAPAKSRLALDLYGAGGKRLAHVTTRPAGETVSTQTTICGSRSFQVSISRVSGGGRYRLLVSKP